MLTLHFDLVYSACVTHTAIVRSVCVTHTVTAHTAQSLRIVLQFVVLVLHTVSRFVMFNACVTHSITVCNV